MLLARQFQDLGIEKIEKVRRNVSKIRPSQRLEEPLQCSINVLK